MSARAGRRPSSVGRDADAVVVLARGGVEVASWPLERWAKPDLALVDALARLALAARQLGCSVLLRDARPELTELLALAGLDLRLQVLGEAEGGEERGIAVDDEVVEGGDPVP